MLRTAALFATAVAGAQAAGNGTYTNPTIHGNTPDPGALWDPDTGLYWVATTGAVASGKMVMHSSPDLVSWTEVGTVFPDNLGHWPKWAGTTCWAPELHITVGGSHVVYFVTDSKETGKLVVGVGVSTSGVKGPYIDVRGQPLLTTSSKDCYGVIDPNYFLDPATGTQYISFKLDGNSCGQPTKIFAASLDSNGTTMKGTPVLLITNDDKSWEGGVTEAPWIMYSGGYYTLFYSGSVYSKPTYAIGTARGKSMTEGPWEKNPKNPILKSSPGAGEPRSTLHFGPGHCSVLELHTSTGHYAMLYAAEEPSGGIRNLMLDTVEWNSEGWPQMVSGGGYPSHAPVAVPT